MAKSLNKPAGFDARLQYSIRLLRKAQKLALTYDSDDGFFLAFSGGKDSQALYHVAKLAGVRFRAHMNFTSVDPPQVIRFVRTCYPDVITHAPVKSIFALAVDRGILPSMRIRWCCADLKESAGAGKVTLIGIRKQESTRRAKRHEIEVSNKQFSGDFDQFKKWQRKTISAKEASLLRRMKREGKKVNEDYFSVNQQDQVRCINGQDSILISPIFNWTEKDVWYFLNEVVRVPHCELYDQGYRRIGCILCPMSSPRQKQREMQDFPHVRRGWLNAIKQIRAGGVLSSKPTFLPETVNGVGSTRSTRLIPHCETGKYPPHPSNPTRYSTMVAVLHRWNRKTNSGIWAAGSNLPIPSTGRVFSKPFS